MELLDIEFDAYKRIFDEFTNKKAIGYSGYPHYADNGQNYVVYFSTPEFTYRCVVPKQQLSRVEEMEYIKQCNVDGVISDYPRLMSTLNY